MWFLVRKWIASVLYPPVFCLLLALVGFALTFFPRTRRKGQILLGVALAALLLLSIPELNQPLVHRMENLYPPQAAVATATLPEDSPPWIVVLGSGARITVTEDDSATAALRATGITRTVEGLRLAQAYPKARLIFTGAGSAAAMERLTRELGFPEERTEIIETPTSTYEEARAVRGRIENGPLILVTSALHMPRAMALFRDAGLDPVAAPTDYRSGPEPQNPALAWSPSAGSWDSWQRLAHEGYGILWARLQGRLRFEDLRP